MHSRSKSAYEHLRRTFQLPSDRHLCRVEKKDYVAPGINDAFFEKLVASAKACTCPPLYVPAQTPTHPLAAPATLIQLRRLAAGVFEGLASGELILLMDEITVCNRLKVGDSEKQGGRERGSARERETRADDPRGTTLTCPPLARTYVLAHTTSSRERATRASFSSVLSTSSMSSWVVMPCWATRPRRSSSST